MGRLRQGEKRILTTLGAYVIPCLNCRRSSRKGGPERRPHRPRGPAKVRPGHERRPPQERRRPRHPPRTVLPPPPEPSRRRTPPARRPHLSFGTPRWVYSSGDESHSGGEECCEASAVVVEDHDAGLFSNRKVFDLEAGVGAFREESEGGFDGGEGNVPSPPRCGESLALLGGRFFLEAEGKHEEYCIFWSLCFD